MDIPTARFLTKHRQTREYNHLEHLIIESYVEQQGKFILTKDYSVKEGSYNRR